MGCCVGCMGGCMGCVSCMGCMDSCRCCMGRWLGACEGPVEGKGAGKCSVGWGGGARVGAWPGGRLLLGCNSLMGDEHAQDRGGHGRCVLG